MSLVSIEQVDNALRLGLNLDDVSDTQRLDDITLKIEQAQGIVLDYIKMDADALVEAGWNDTEDTPGNITSAIILTVRCLLDDTEDSNDILSGLSGLVPTNVRNPLVALLYRFRDPAIA